MALRLEYTIYPLGKNKKFPFLNGMKPVTEVIYHELLESRNQSGIGNV